MTLATRLVGLALCTLAAATLAATETRPSFDERIDALVTDGYERPGPALATLEQLGREGTATVDARRALLQAMGSVEAQSGAAARAGARADQLVALAPDDPSGRALAASNLVRALVADNAGQIDVAAALAQSALPAFQGGCPAEATRSQAALASSCDYRSAWTALGLLERRAFSQGLNALATAHAQVALGLAEGARDLRRQAVNLGALAGYAQERGEGELAQHLMGRLRRLAGQLTEPIEQAQFRNAEARLARLRDDRAGALRAFEEAYALAALADAPRLEARVLTNLSDAYTRLGRPADALRAAERGLKIVRLHSDLRAEQLLVHNAGIAKIGLGRLAEGKQDVARLLELRQRTGETGRQVEVLLEFGEALAAAGDARGALELYHRERALSNELMRANRAVALKELQTRFDADARQRDIELLARDNALKTAELANRDLLQRLWWLLAAVLLLAVGLVTLLYRRVRDTHRQLAASHLQLQAQSERDPLTNLANRRHFQSVMTGLAADGGFEGALLLVDIDHFKGVNDGHGHAAGDQVLVEVARRLHLAVRSGDLVVRWGGEEFLIVAPRAAPEQAEQIAGRVLRVIGEAPIALDDARTLRVTASIGYARFPLPPFDTAVPWEQATNLADMALYTAKSQGRNRAVGIISTTADSAAALRDVEADFDRAWHEGRVTLLQTAGPQWRDNVRAA